MDQVQYLMNDSTSLKHNKNQVISKREIRHTDIHELILTKQNFKGTFLVQKYYVSSVALNKAIIPGNI